MTVISNILLIISSTDRKAIAATKDVRRVALWLGHASIQSTGPLSGNSALVGMAAHAGRRALNGHNDR